MPSDSIFKTPDLEVEISEGDKKAFIEGKTGVPFKTFVALVLQRKVTKLFEEWGKSPVIMDSDLLTQLASAPQDNAENRAHLVLTSIGMGVLGGIFGMAVLGALLAVLKQPIGFTGYASIAGSLLVIAALIKVAMQIKKKNRAEKILDIMENVAWTLKK